MSAVGFLTTVCLFSSVILTGITVPGSHLVP